MRVLEHLLQSMFFSPIAIVTCCQQVFCNSSCILLLGIEQSQALKSNKHGSGISFLSLIFFFFFLVLYFLCLLLQVWSCGSGLTVLGRLGCLCLLLALWLAPISLLGGENSVKTNPRLTKGAVTGSALIHIFPPFLLYQHLQLCTLWQIRSAWKLTALSYCVRRRVVFSGIASPS